MGPRLLAAVAAGSAVMMTGAVVMGAAAPAGACGGLVGENGTIKLERTTTLAAWSHGVERYVTAFQFSGEGKSVGSLVPLPAVPTKVERAGDWTLQRLEREVAPPQAAAGRSAAPAAEDSSAEEIYNTRIDA